MVRHSSEDVKLTLAKSDKALRTVGEVASMLDIQPHVLRFWEGKFHALDPCKRNGRRYYSPADIALLQQIKDLLYAQGYTIKGAAALLNDDTSVSDAHAEHHTDANAESAVAVTIDQASIEQAKQTLLDAKERLIKLSDSL